MVLLVLLLLLASLSKRRASPLAIRFCSVGPLNPVMQCEDTDEEGEEVEEGQRTEGDRVTIPSQCERNDRGRGESSREEEAIG